MDKLRLLKVLVVGLCIIAGSLPATAAIISSDSFSIALGKIDGSTAWYGNENAGTNSPATIGDFSYSPIATSDYFSGTGPVFTGKTLGNGAAGSFSGDSSIFALNITGSYTGTPVDAAAVPNYKITVEITGVSIYGVGYTGLTTGDFQFLETTAGHSASSPSVAYNIVSAIIPGLDVASNYSLLAWNPDDYEVDGTSFTRTLTLGNVSLLAVDGLIIEGKVNVSYDAVPEPATMTLLALGGVALLRRKRD